MQERLIELGFDPKGADGIYGMNTQQAVISLLPILDNIERAIIHEPKDLMEHPWVKGILTLANQLENQLESIGLKKIGTVGEIFNPQLHDAVAMDDADGDSEVIAEVLQTGYRFNEIIIRPAMVKVTKK